MRSIEQSCFWLATRQAQAGPVQLEASCDADIVIVGAGFTGLWTAFFLKQLDPNKDIVIVEQGVAGYGASGRNAGIVSASIDHSHALAMKHFGKEEAARLAKIGIRNLDELAEYAADCDFERSGQLLVALTDKHLHDLENNLQVAEKLEIPGYKILSREAAIAELNCQLYLGAASIQNAGIVNPVRLVDKLKADLQKSNVRFFERTRVLEIKGNIVRCENGTITGKKIVLATDSYTHHLFPHLLWRFVPLYDYVQVSEPLNEAQKESIGWNNRQGVVDCRNFFNYYRITSDNRILWGTSEASYYSPNRVDESCDHSEYHYKTLQESFVRHFQQLQELSFPFKWGGPIASTTRLTPFFGSLEAGRVIYALGYTGHGIGSTRIAGKILAHMALSKESELLSLSIVLQQPFPYPPEPIRSLSISAVTQSLREVDKGGSPNMILKLLDAFGIGFSS